MAVLASHAQNRTLRRETVSNAIHEALQQLPNAAMRFLSQSVSPVIQGLVVGGILKLVQYLATLVAPGVTGTSTYALITLISDMPFDFMPLFVAYGASQALSCSTVASLCIAAALVSPRLLALGDTLGGADAVTFFGLSIPLIDYGSTVLPALFSALALKACELLFARLLPKALRTDLVEPCALLLSAAISLAWLAPAGYHVGVWIVERLIEVQSFSGLLAVAAWTGALPLLDMVGLHTLVAPFMLEYMRSFGYDPLFRTGLLLHLLTEGGCALACALLNERGEERSKAISACISSVVAGVPEPALYNCTLKSHGGLAGAIAGGLLSGGIAGFFGVRSYVITKNTILSLPVFMETALPMAAACAVGFATAFFITYLAGRFGTHAQPETDSTQTNSDVIEKENR